jgi:3-hydroxyethyl bacteriochlorophyllide a dehydrogenase
LTTAQTIIFTEPRRVSVAEHDVPALDPADVLVEVAYSSISPGTERWVLTGRMEVPGRPDLAAFPHVPGYQAAGIVREAGRAVQGLRPDDRVFSRNCRAPDGWLGSWWGGHVGLHVAHYRDVIALPEAVSLRGGSSLLLAQVGYNGAMKPRVSPGDVAVVIGAGLVGQYAGQVLRSRGAHVIACDLRASRLAVAAQHSADQVFDSSAGDLAAVIAARYGEGVDIVVETASSNRTVRMAAGLLRRGGQLVLNGYYPPAESTLDWHWFRRKELTLYFPDSRTRERLEATLRLIESGHVKVEETVTHEFPVSRAPEAYDLLLDPEVESLGIVIDWT